MEIDMNKEQRKSKDRQIICRMDDDLFLDLELIRESLGVNWSFQVRQFLQDKVDELKPTMRVKTKR
jgi:hypothetical protein